MEPSEFVNLKGIEYFNFEEDFIEDNVRCIPMVVRFKMDAVGIKLKLSEWSKFNTEERVALAMLSVSDPVNKTNYYGYLRGLVNKYTQQNATLIDVEPSPAWAQLNKIPTPVLQKTEELELKITLRQWYSLSDIQRFVLLKLCRPGHENKNFPQAMLEFGLI